MVQPNENGQSECPVCGLAKCECPTPLGECVGCKAQLYEADRWFTDSEGAHFCADCFPGGES